MKTKKNQKRAIRSKWFVVLSAAVLMHEKMFENVLFYWQLWLLFSFLLLLLGSISRLPICSRKWC